MNANTHRRAVELAHRALRALPAAQHPEIEAQLARVEHTMNAAQDDAFSKDLKTVARAFEEDMQPICKAVIEALHAGDRHALEGLRAMLPDLLAEVNESPELADVLTRQLGRELLAGLRGDAEEGGAEA